MNVLAKALAMALAPLRLVAAAADGAPDDELTEVVVIAPEPRYVAPTTRDRIGRVWVPVQMDGRGVFRLVLDTGAQHSAVTAATAERIGAPIDESKNVIVHGTTGSSVSPTIQLGSLVLGDLMLEPSSIPIVAEVFGGADGLLGTEGMQNHRIFIDFRHDNIVIARSENRSAAAGFGTLRFLPDADRLIAVRARVGGVGVRAIIDTGSQATVGNPALQTALRRHLRSSSSGSEDRVQGATGDWQTGVGANLSSLELGDLIVRNAYVTFADLQIFHHWKLSDEPAMVIGMDIIGLVDQLVIDYRRRELQIKPRARR